MWIKPKNRGQSGWSLIELLVAIAIIGILSGLGFISMFHYRVNIRANEGLRQVTGHVRMARALAIKNNTSVRMQFVKMDGSVPLNGYYICQVALGAVAGCKPSGDNNGDCCSIRKSYKLPKGIVFKRPLSSLPLMPTSPVTVAADHNTHDGVTVTKNKDSTDGKWFHFSATGAASRNVVMYISPEVDLDVSNRRVKGVYIRHLSGTVRSWKFNGSNWY